MLEIKGRIMEDKKFVDKSMDKNEQNKQTLQDKKQEYGKAGDEKFDLEAIEKTFASYKKGQMFDGVVVIKRDDGAIFNIGGKNDAFLPREEVENYDNILIGDRFKVVITKSKNEEGLIEVSKDLADNQILQSQNASRLKLGSTFSFVPSGYDENGLTSKMGEYQIFIPNSEVSLTYYDKRKCVGKQFDAVVTEIDKENKKIVASVRLLEEQIKKTNEELFWNSIFINKIVKGKVKKIMPYGAFIEVGGVDCFLHISNMSYQRISSPEQVLKIGEEYTFKVIEVDRENKKVALSLKALTDSPKLSAIKQLEIGQIYTGEVVKILKFGAIVKLENGASGLLHIKNATDENNRQIYEIVKLDQKVKVQVIDKNIDEEKVSFKLIEVL